MQLNKRTLKIAGIVVAAVLVVLIALPFFINVNSSRPKIESELTNTLSGPRHPLRQLCRSRVKGSAFPSSTRTFKELRCDERGLARGRILRCPRVTRVLGVIKPGSGSEEPSPTGGLAGRPSVVGRGLHR